MPQSNFTIFSSSDGPIRVVFREATAEQHDSCFKLSGDAFRFPLSQSDYLVREKKSSHDLLQKNASTRLWCIYLEDRPKEVLATGKTIRRDLLVQDTGGVREEPGYCLASVVTDPKYRSCGLASHLLTQISLWLDGPGNATASMLYSSIGEFYVGRGWKKQSSFQSILTIPQQLNSIDKPYSVETRALHKTEVTTRASIDIQDIKERFGMSSVSPGEIKFAVLPTATILTKLHDRAHFMGSKLHGKSPEKHGSVCDLTEAWIYWFHDFRKQQLGVQRIRVPLPWTDTHVKSVAQLLLDALGEATKWGLPKMVVWEPHECTQRAMELLADNSHAKVENEERVNKSITSIRWRNSDESSKISLQLNKFYAWS